MQPRTTRSLQYVGPAPTDPEQTMAATGRGRRPWPTSAEAWRELLDEPHSIFVLTEREREAMIVCHAEWPRGATNLQYMTQLEMARQIGVSVVTFRRYLHVATYKLGLTEFAPRMNKIGATVRRALLAATDESSTCDLCQRNLGRVPVPRGELTWAELMGPPRFLERVSIDHIVPVARGGTDDVSNLRVVHAWCNLSDGARTPADELQPPPFGYVRRTQILPNGRGPRKWIEVDDPAAAAVRFLLGEYATGKHSVASLCRLVKRRARRFDRKTIAPLVLGSPQARADEVLYILQYHARDRSPRELRSGYAPLVPAEIAEACRPRLAIRWERIRKARETRERRMLERGAHPRSA